VDFNSYFTLMSPSVGKQRRLWFYFYGFNIAILAGLFSALSGRLLGRWRGGLGIGLYTLLVGARTAVVRAAITSSLDLFARQVGRDSCT
jgi:predicted membrane metal-binding protein